MASIAAPAATQRSNASAPSTALGDRFVGVAGSDPGSVRQRARARSRVLPRQLGQRNRLSGGEQLLRPPHRFEPLQCEADKSKRSKTA